MIRLRTWILLEHALFVFLFAVLVKVIVESKPLDHKALLPSIIYAFLFFLFFRKHIRIDIMRRNKFWQLAYLPISILAYIALDLLFDHFNREFFLRNATLFGALGLIHGMVQVFLLSRVESESDVKF